MRIENQVLVERRMILMLLCSNVTYLCDDLLHKHFDLENIQNGGLEEALQSRITFYQKRIPGLAATCVVLTQ